MSTIVFWCRTSWKERAVLGNWRSRRMNGGPLRPLLLLAIDAVARRMHCYFYWLTGSAITLPSLQDLKDLFRRAGEVRFGKQQHHLRQGFSFL